MKSICDDADCMRAGFKAELKEVVDMLAIERLAVSCLSLEAAGTVDGLVSRLEPSLEADSEGTGGTDRAPISDVSYSEYLKRLEPKCRQGTTSECLEPKWSERLEPKCLDSVVDEVYLNLQSLRLCSFVPTVLSDEECARIRFNLLNDDCMKLNDEDLCLFNNLSACSSSDDDYNDFACFDSFSACSASGHDDSVGFSLMPNVLRQSGHDIDDDQRCYEFFSHALSQNVGLGRPASA